MELAVDLIPKMLIARLDWYGCVVPVPIRSRCAAVLHSETAGALPVTYCCCRCTNQHLKRHTIRGTHGFLCLLPFYVEDCPYYENLVIVSHLSTHVAFCPAGICVCSLILYAHE